MTRTLTTKAGGVVAAVLVGGMAMGCTPAATVQTNGNSSGAASGGTTQGVPEQSFSRFPDLPVPAGAKINLDKTVVFGSGEEWFGRITLTVGFNSDQMFDFFKQELPGFNWQEITSVRSATSVLTYQRRERIATIQISGRTLTGSDVMVTVSPKGAPMQAPPMQMSSPTAPVQAYPLPKR